MISVVSIFRPYISNWFFVLIILIGSNKNDTNRKLYIEDDDVPVFHQRVN